MPLIRSRLPGSSIAEWFTDAPAMARETWVPRPLAMEAISHGHGESGGHRQLARVTGNVEGIVPPATLTSGRRTHRMAPASI